jgi:ubiquinone/menaquinone biosynthesis C-methylase UbiE
VLDVGTGSGGFISILEKTFPHARITAIDPHRESLETARSNHPGLTFLEMEAGQLDFDDNAFDVVSLSKVLHHLPKIKKALKEIRRVVKPGGYIIINEPISDNLTPAQEVHKMYHHFRSRIDRLLGTYHRKTFSKDAILDLLKTAELPVQFFFEQKKNVNLADIEENIELRTGKMIQMLEKIRDKDDYHTLKPRIEEFRQKAMKYGFQPATNLLIVIRKK